MSEYLTDPVRQDALRDALISAFKMGSCTAPTARIGYSRHRHFTVPTQIYVKEANSLAHHGHHTLELTTKDRPALLATVGIVFDEMNIQVHGARIATMGERAEDVFYISGKDGVMSSDEQQALISALHDALA